MNVYNALALAVDIIHVLVIIFWCGGFAMSETRYTAFRHWHSIFGVVIVAIQVIFSMRCPLVLMSGYLRELADPGYTDNFLYKPFVVEMLKKIFGFEAPAIIITVIAFIGTGLMIITLIHLRTRKTAKT